MKDVLRASSTFQEGKGPLSKMLLMTSRKKKTESTIGYSNLEATWQRSLFRVGQERLKKKWRQQEENSRHFVF